MSCIHVGSVDAHVDHTLNIAHFDVCDNIEKTPDVELVFDPPAVAGASVTTWHQRPEGGFRVSVRFTGDQNPKSVVLRRVGYHYFWFGTAAVFSNS